MSWQTRTDVRYVVKDGHTLGYIFDAQPGLMGVLSSKKDGHHPNGGPVSISFSEIRPATVEDFETFRVKVPPDFNKDVKMGMFSDEELVLMADRQDCLEANQEEFVAALKVRGLEDSGPEYAAFAKEFADNKLREQDNKPQGPIRKDVID